MYERRPRATATPDRIREFVYNAIHTARRARGIYAVVDVPQPLFQADDVEGCNWHMRSLRAAAGYEATIRKAINMARARFNLTD